MPDAPQGIRPYMWHLMVRTVAEHMHMAYNSKERKYVDTWRDFEAEADEALEAAVKVLAADDWPKSEKAPK